MPLEKQPPSGAVSEGVKSLPCARGMLGTVLDLIDFHVHPPTFLSQLRCFVERIIRKRLSDSFVRNSAIVRLRTFTFDTADSTFNRKQRSES